MFLAVLLLGAAAAWRVRDRSRPVPVLRPGERQVFVDPALSDASCATYAAQSRACGGGEAQAFRSLSAAARAATAGTTVLIREGMYREQIVTSASGTAEAPITFLAYEGEKAVLTGPLDPAIDLSERRHIVIDGLTVQAVVGWLRAVKASSSIVRRSTFSDATAADARGGLLFVGGADNQIRDNVIVGGHDNILLIDSERVVVAGNTVMRGRHSLFAILCGSRNVVRRNRFVNEWERIGLVGDCSGVPPEAPHRQNGTRRNLIEENLFYFTPGRTAAVPHAGLQYAGQEGLIRSNVFLGTSGAGLEMSLHSGDAEFNVRNRIGHNVFLAAGRSGIELPGTGGGAFEDNIFKNNILYASRMTAKDAVGARQLQGRAVQVLTRRLTGFLMERNVIYGVVPRQRHVITVVGADADTGVEPGALAAWQKTAPHVFRDNIDIRPVFRDDREFDFRLAPESALVDEGAFLTRARFAGSGTTLAVEDVNWFFDGFGIAGERGDEIQIEGGTRSARVLQANADTRSLTLDAPLTWKAGEGVSLRYSGSAPAVGLSEAIAPPAPRKN